MKKTLKKLKKTIIDQTYRTKMMNYLSKHISAGTCELLLLGSEELEALSSFFTFNKSHIAR